MVAADAVQAGSASAAAGPSVPAAVKQQTGAADAANGSDAASSSQQHQQPWRRAHDAASGPSASTRSTSLFIQAGDLVIVFLSRDRPPLPITVTPGQALANTYGTFLHNEMVGLPFGAKLASRNGRGFIHLLRPTPELWTIALPHRTQILYSPDMSFIAAHLGLTPGARVIEAGTGSGSFSHYATRCVARRHPQSSGHGWIGRPAAPGQMSRRKAKLSGAQRRQQKRRNGGGKSEGGVTSESSSGSSSSDSSDSSNEDEMEKKEPVDDHEAHVLERLSAPPDVEVGPKDGRVWSFEFHAGRAAKAWDEFEQHGLFPTLSLRHRNVVKLGFGLEDAADAIFLDLPAPWQALHHAAQAMRRDVACRICCFSPCVEQVLKTVAALRRGLTHEEAEGPTLNMNVDAAVSGDHDDDASTKGDEVARWTDIETYECLQRTHVSVWTGPGTTCPAAPIDEAILRIRHIEGKKARRRNIQIERTRREREMRQRALADENIDAANADGHNEAAAVGEKRKRNEADEGGGDPESIDDDDGAEAEEKKEGDAKASNGAGAGEAELVPPPRDQPTDPTAQADLLASGAMTTTRDGKLLRRANVYGRPFPEMRGHTSYLTFATLLPRAVKQESDPTLEREKAAEQRKAAQAERARARKEAAQPQPQPSQS